MTQSRWMKPHLSHRKYDPHFLALCWIVGLVCGMELFLHGQQSTASLMRGILWSPVSFVRLLIFCVIPFLVTAYAVFASAPRVLLAASFLKACLYSFVSCGIFVVFGSAGWLLRGLLLFVSSICTVLLYILWCRILSGRSVSLFMLLAFVCAVFGACGVDRYIIVPFLAGLIEI